MKPGMRLVVAMVALTLALGAARPAQDSDRIRRLLPGLWIANQASPGGVSVRATSDYGRDGFVVYEGHVTGPGLDFAYRVRSRWSVEGDALVAEVVETNQPEVLPVGSRKRDTVLSIDGRRYRYRDEQGEEHEERRVGAD